MFQCIGCSKQLVEEGEEQVRQTEMMTRTEGGTPATNQAVKSLTSQLKDVALKFTGAKKPRSSGVGPSTYRRGSRPNDNNSDELRDTPAISRQPSGCDSPLAAWLNNDSTLNNSQSMNAAGSSILSMNSSRDELSFVNANDTEGEWIAQDMPGVFLTIKQLPDGSKDLRRVRFSRQRFGEDDAKKWWEDNRERIQAQYL